MSEEFMIIYNCIIGVVDLGISLYFLDYIMERRVKSILLTYILLGVAVIIFRQVELVLQNINVLLGLAMVPFLCVITFSIPYKTSWKKMILFNVIYAGTGILAEIMASAIINFFLGFRLKDHSNPMVNYIDQGIGSLLSAQLAYIQGFFLLFLYQRRKKSIEKSEMLFMLLNMSYQIIVTILFYNTCKEYDIFSSIVGIMMFSFSCGMNIYTLYAMEKMRESKEAKKRYKELMDQREKELLYYENQYQKIENFRILRHEFANYLQTVQQMGGNNKNIAEEMLAAMEKKLVE